MLSSRDLLAEGIFGCCGLRQGLEEGSPFSTVGVDAL